MVFKVTDESLLYFEIKPKYRVIQTQTLVLRKHGDRTVCSCRHSKLSARVRSMYCVWRLYCVQL